MKQKIALILICGSLAVMPFLVSARGLVPCGGYDPAQAGGVEKPCTVRDVFVLIAKVTNFLIAMAGVFAVYEIINAGFWLVISMGNEEAITKHKSAISTAIVGLILVMMAFIFINTVVNFILIRSLGNANNKRCKFDLSNPLNYLAINQDQCATPQ